MKNRFDIQPPTEAVFLCLKITRLLIEPGIDIADNQGLHFFAGLDLMPVAVVRMTGGTLKVDQRAGAFITEPLQVLYIVVVPVKAILPSVLQVDPLAEDYVYNSTYAFQENKMGMGRELEGLELYPINPTNMFNFEGGGKPVLTFGLHNIELPIAERDDSGGLAASIGNVAKAIYNGAASTFNEGMQGGNMGDMVADGVAEMGNTARRIENGEGTTADIENAVAAGL